MENLGQQSWEMGLRGESTRLERSSSLRPWSMAFTALESLGRLLGSNIWQNSGDNNEGRGTRGRGTK